MENPYVTGSIGATIMVVLGIGYKIFQAVNHKRIRSDCCGKKIVMSVDVEPTSPPQSRQPSDTFTIREVQNQTKEQETHPPVIKIIE
jgi:hypothetical protein